MDYQTIGLLYGVGGVIGTLVSLAGAVVSIFVGASLRGSRSIGAWVLAVAFLLDFLMGLFSSLSGLIINWLSSNPGISVYETVNLVVTSGFVFSALLTVLAFTLFLTNAKSAGAGEVSRA